MNQTQNQTGRPAQERDEFNDSSFASRDARDAFMLSLPYPWNKVITSTSKESDELKACKDTFSDKRKHFTGFSDGVSYFDWRSDILTFLHTTNMRISTKISQIRGLMDCHRHPVLKGLARSLNADPDTYRKIILTLESNWGGQERAYAWISQRFFGGEKLKVNDLTSCLEFKLRIDDYISHCEATGNTSSLTSVENFQRMSDTLLTPFHLADIVAEKQRRVLVNDLTTIDIVQEWLAIKIDNMKKQEIMSGKTSVAAKPKEVTGKTFLLEASSSANNHTVSAGAGAVSSPVEGADSPQPYEDYGDNPAPPVYTEDNYDSCDEELAIQVTGSDKPDIALLARQGFRPDLCPYCKSKDQKNRHFLTQCDRFAKLNWRQRSEWASRSGSCRNCLKTGHTIAKCTSRYTCKTCKGRHHSLLHKTD